MPRPLVKSRKSTNPGKKITSADLELLQSSPELPELDATTQEDDDPRPISRASSEPGPSTSTASTSGFVQPQTRPKKKRNRVSHSVIDNYPFTEEQEVILREYIMNQPALYEKRHREYSNHKTKLDLWAKCAALMPDDCTWLQCRKFFEQKRTAYGKIEMCETKSGSARRERTIREEKIMEDWSFLKGHIAHLKTSSSQKFSGNESSSSGNETAASQLSTHSVERRRLKKLTKRTSAALSVSSSQEPSSSHEREDLATSQDDTANIPTIQSIIDRAATMTEDTEPWRGTTIYYFTKMIGNHVYDLPADERNEAMMGAMQYVLDFGKKRRTTNPDAQTTQDPPVVEAAQPPTRLQPPTSQYTPLQPVPSVHTPVRHPNPAQPPIIHGAPLQGQPQIIQGPPIQYPGQIQYPPTPGNWVPVPGQQPYTIYQPTSYQQVAPTTTTYQHVAHTSVTPSTGAYHYMHSAQQPSTSSYVPPTTSSGGYVPPATTSSLLNSPATTKFLESIGDLQVFSTIASSVHTPQGTDGEDAADPTNKTN